MPNATHPQRILLAGCGQLGRMIGLQLARHHEVYGLRRSPAPLPAPIEGLQADLLDSAGLAAMLPDQVDQVIYCLSPGSYDDAGYQAAYVTALDNLLGLLEARAKAPQRVFFISSTAVYHQNDDSWVDEASPTEPARFSGKRLLEAEARLARSPLAGTSIRFSGIYGGQRRGLLEKVRSGKVANAGASPYTNRIHEADCVGVVEHLVQRQLSGMPLADCYLASDCEPVRQAELVAWLQDQIDCVAPDPAARPVFRAGSKRCSNRRLLDSGYRFRYPSFREGYRAML